MLIWQDIVFITIVLLQLLVTLMTVPKSSRTSCVILLVLTILLVALELYVSAGITFAIAMIVFVTAIRTRILSETQS